MRNVCLLNNDEQVTTPKATNLNGQLWQQYDESGKIESVTFDFKGNLLSKKQQVISSTVLKTALDNYETYLVDWTGLPNILGAQIFETSSEFDALNRVTKITLPENVNSERKEITPTYNRAGALEKVSYDGTEYVKNIGYNAKGQRLLIAFGNDIMTRYCYHNITFRLLRQRSEKYVKSQSGNTITYTPQSGTNKQDDGFNFDLVGNILKILHRVNDCGINGSTLGSNALDRNFDYDPLYRVISADGRESDTQNQNDYLYSDAPAPSTPNANNVRAYTRNYAYDKLGNIQQLKQLGTNGFTRNFTYNTGHNTLQKVETPTPTLIEDFTYDVCGNQLTAGTTRNYVWNAGNQLITYYNQVGSSDPTIFAQYDYSGMNRVSKLVKTGTTYERTIYIDGIFEYHILENGTTYEKNYVHVMDDQSRIAMVRVGTPFPDDIADSVTYNLENQIGSSILRLSTNGSMIDKEEYYPFGDSSLRTFTKKRYRYVGKEKDLESGLYYYGARYYLAWTCRFISVDPLAGDYPFYTPYNYAGNKPINKIDIDGMQEQAEVEPPTIKYITQQVGDRFPSNEEQGKMAVGTTIFTPEGEIYELKDRHGGYYYKAFVNVTDDYTATVNCGCPKKQSYISKLIDDFARWEANSIFHSGNADPVNSGGKYSGVQGMYKLADKQDEIAGKLSYIPLPITKGIGQILSTEADIFRIIADYNTLSPTDATWNTGIRATTFILDKKIDSKIDKIENPVVKYGVDQVTKKGIDEVKNNMITKPKNQEKK
ncbi:MAG TPA: RHS repeat-associated core domain-containing protein [Crocinitomicaceae bacterium]|nr:RHS repeat-associated core domain-containing protein [Crocinitomicaceae bacterium]